MAAMENIQSPNSSRTTQVSRNATPHFKQTQWSRLVFENDTDQLNLERPYPSARINNPPGGAINYTTTPPTGANYPDYLIGVRILKERMLIYVKNAC